MAWDKDQPAGSTKVSASDDLIRANQDAIETAMDEEHAFSTGGTQTGRHSFMQDTSANISGASPSLENGGIAFSTDARSGFQTLQVRASGSMVNADVEPLDGSSNPTLPRVNAQSKFTVCQFAEHVALTISSGTVDIALTGSPRRTLTLTENITLNNPTGSVSGHLTEFEIFLAQDGTGGRTITWGSAYRSVSGAVQIATGANEKTLLSFRSTTDGTYIVSSIPDWDNSIT